VSHSAHEDPTSCWILDLRYHLFLEKDRSLVCYSHREYMPTTMIRSRLRSGWKERPLSGSLSYSARSCILTRPFWTIFGLYRIQQGSPHGCLVRSFSYGYAVILLSCAVNADLALILYAWMRQAGHQQNADQGLYVSINNQNETTKSSMRDSEDLAVYQMLYLPYRSSHEKD
jgi:hypothetical protein